MKHQIKYIILVSAIVVLAGILIFQKFSFTEEMAKTTSNKFFTILMSKNSRKEFEEIYPNYGKGPRIITPVICMFNSITKRDDGCYDVYASYEVSKAKTNTIYIIVDRNGKIVNSRGVSPACYDKTLEYAQKIGCLTVSENDVEIEKVIKDRNLRQNLDNLANTMIQYANDQIKSNGKISITYGFASGNVVLTNNTPYDFDYGEIKCQVNFYSNDGSLTNTQDVYISNLPAYGSTSGMVYAETNSSSRYSITHSIIDNFNFRNKVKDHIIKEAQRDVIYER